MFSDPPKILIETLTDAEISDVVRWWDSLSLRQREIVCDLIDMPNCRVQMVDQQTAEASQVVELSGDDWEAHWADTWEQDWREYLIDHPEIVFTFRTQICRNESK